MSKTVAGLFGSMDEAEQAKENLVTGGYPASQISVVANEDLSCFTTLSSITEGRADSQETDDAGAVLKVATKDQSALEVAQLQRRYGAKDIDGAYGEVAGSGVSTDQSDTVLAPTEVVSFDSDDLSGR